MVVAGFFLFTSPLRPLGRRSCVDVFLFCPNRFVANLCTPCRLVILLLPSQFLYPLDFLSFLVLTSTHCLLKLYTNRSMPCTTTHCVLIAMQPWL